MRVKTFDKINESESNIFKKYVYLILFGIRYKFYKIFTSAILFRLHPLVTVNVIVSALRRFHCLGKVQVFKNLFDQ